MMNGNEQLKENRKRRRKQKNKNPDTGYTESDQRCSSNNSDSYYDQEEDSFSLSKNKGKK